MGGLAGWVAFRQRPARGDDGEHKGEVTVGARIGGRQGQSARSVAWRADAPAFLSVTVVLGLGRWPCSGQLMTLQKMYAKLCGSVHLHVFDEETHGLYQVLRESRIDQEIFRY